MNLNLFLKDMKRNTPGLILWMIVIVILMSVTMAVYPTFLENQSKILAMMSIVPKGALQFKGISDLNDLLSVMGFYAANNVIYMMLLGSIFAIVLASNIFLKEEYSKTAEYLLTRPLTRSEVFLSKLAVLVVQILLLNVVTAIVGFTCMSLVESGSFSIRAFLILSLYTLLLNLIFAAAGLFISTLVRRPKPITTFSIGFVLILYFIHTVSKITAGVSKIGYLSPFHYINLDAFSPEYNISLMHILYFIGLSFLLTLLSFRLYRRKDIYT
jgi:ABC-2 type transport system permease protein